MAPKNKWEQLVYEYATLELQQIEAERIRRLEILRKLKTASKEEKNEGAWNHQRESV